MDVAHDEVDTKTPSSSSSAAAAATAASSTSSLKSAISTRPFKTTNEFVELLTIEQKASIADGKRMFDELLSQLPLRNQMVEVEPIMVNSDGKSHTTPSLVRQQAQQQAQRDRSGPLGTNGSLPLVLIYSNIEADTSVPITYVHSLSLFHSLPLTLSLFLPLFLFLSLTLYLFLRRMCRFFQDPKHNKALIEIGVSHTIQELVTSDQRVLGDEKMGKKVTPIGFAMQMAASDKSAIETLLQKPEKPVKTWKNFLPLAKKDQTVFISNLGRDTCDGHPVMNHFFSAMEREMLQVSLSIALHSHPLLEGIRDLKA